MRNLNLTELAYGSDKARNLFREMIQKAANEVGFEAEDIPLMVEAIPMANESVMLIITKIEDPEELDTRFSKFSQAEDDDDIWSSLATELLEGADGLLNLLGDAAKAAAAEKNGAGNAAPEKNVDSALQIRTFQLSDLDQVCAAARQTGRIFAGSSILYKNPSTGVYYLVLKRGDSDELAFSRTCNILSEYGSRIKYDSATEAYYAEHYEVIVRENALAVLSSI